ncbi:hypothetical protein N9T26_01565 [Alphaproteobacteria bacterium]|nr:hypothetical protein [Alphaproteobacteria bacterium]
MRRLLAGAGIYHPTFLPMLWAAACLCHWRSSLRALFRRSTTLSQNPKLLLYIDQSRQLILKFKHGDALHRAGSGPICGLVLARVLRHGL